MTLGSRLRARVTFDRHELPPAFWFLWMGTVINRLGGFAVPFLMLYLTARLGMSAATAAGVVSALGAGSFLAQLTGGELADRFGRRPVMLLSFFVAPLAMLGVGLARDPLPLIISTLALGFFMDLYRPAVSAAVIDLVPVDKRTRAFGYIYWAINLGAALAPIAAGLLANIDFFLLFAGDALTTAIFGLVVLARVPESQARDVAAVARTRVASRAGIALRDSMLLAFVLLSLLIGIIYSQGQVTLPLDMAADGLRPSDYGLAIAVNGGLIVLITIAVSRMAERWHRYATMAASALLLGTGFGLTGLADALPFYAFSVAVWTLGEVIGAAVAPVVVAEMSPPAMRGLYQGIWGSSWGLAFFIGPVVGGLIYEQLGSGTLWTATFLLGIGLCVSYLALSFPAARRAEAAAVRDAPGQGWPRDD
jgi:MFS family permease